MKKYWPLLIILSIVAFLFTFRLGRNLLSDWDECIYAGYAVTMKLTDNFLYNVWNSQIIFDKSPFYIWILQLPLLFSRTEFLLRLPTVLASLSLLTAIYVFAQRFFSRSVAILATLLMLTGEVFVIYSTKVSTDIFFTLFIFLGFCFWISQPKYKILNTKYWLWSGLFFGLAMMVKGFGIAPYLGTLFLTIFLNFKWSRLKDFFKLIGVFLLIGMPWHFYALLSHQKEFVQMYIVDNFYKRSTFPVEFHRERWWFYFGLLYRELSLWLFAAFIFPLTVILNAVKDLAKRTSSRNNVRTRFLATLGMTMKKNELIYTILLLIVIPLLGITRVQTRIAWYIMPLYPFIAIYLAYCLSLLIEFASDIFQKKYRYVIRYTLYGILIVLIAFDAGKLILNEAKLFKPERTIEPRYEVMLKAKQYSSKELNYLVAFGERQAKDILPPDEQLTYTWWYGGNACAVYYSDKKVNYFYSISEFEQSLKTKKGLFLIPNADSQIIENLSIKSLFKNSEYTLFTF